MKSINIEVNSLYALSSGSLARIDLTIQETISEIMSEGLSEAQNLDVENGIIYYTIDSGIYAMGTDATEPATSPFIKYSSDSAWGIMYGFEVENAESISETAEIFPNNFVEIYSTTGDLLEGIEVGIAPNGFYFNN